MYGPGYASHTQRLRISDYESQGNRVGLRAGTHFLQGTLGLECLDTKQKNSAVFFPRKHKILNWICTLKKRKNSFRNDLFHSCERIFKCVLGLGPVAIHFLF